MTCSAFALLAVLLLFPLVLIWNLTESKSVKIRRARTNGYTWKQIAKRFNTTPTTAARWAKA